ncbi:MAG: thiamine phosphate synthase [Myxococcaceae bacterium]
MSLPRLILITDWSLGADTLLSRLAAALSLGPSVAVQHRHPEASGRQFFEEAKKISELTSRAGCALFVNGRLDVALLTRANLHLPSNGLTPTDVRPLLPAGCLLSVAVHGGDLPEVAAGADLALVAPVFAAGSKPGDSRRPLGPEAYFALARALPCPAFALGGITPATARLLPKAAGYAAISSVLHSDDPKAAAAAFLGGA